MPFNFMPFKPRWFNFLVHNLSAWVWLDFASVFHMLFAYSRKKYDKKGKKYPTYLTILFFWSMQPPVLYPDAFSYCWISISNKYVKQVVLINHSWISHTLQKGWELKFYLFFKKWERVHFSPKEGEVGKIVEE